MSAQALLDKWRNLALLAAAELLAMALWFSASAVVPQLAEEWQLTGNQQAGLTISVQLGFVSGALISAVLNLADRYDLRYLIASSALLGALFNAALALSGLSFGTVLLLRFLTGFTLAGVYPPGMKLVATWCKEDRGLGIGILVGALTLGSATPHLLNALPFIDTAGMPPWQNVILGASALATTGALLCILFVRTGPYLSGKAEFNWRYAFAAFRDRPSRLANFGYLGHMWELYAMWAWAPLFIIASYQHAGWSLEAARLSGFAVIGIGAIGCVIAGRYADRIGRTTVTIISMLVSGSCALLVGLFFDHPSWITIVCLIWGFAIVADSAQFSAAISELADPHYAGTALTIQTSAGFLLTLITIQIVPHIVELLGWRYVFMFLAIGPAFGVWSMYRLRQLPEAAKIASGNR